MNNTSNNNNKILDTSNISNIETDTTDNNNTKKNKQNNVNQNNNFNDNSDCSNEEEKNEHKIEKKNKKNNNNNSNNDFNSNNNNNDNPTAITQKNQNDNDNNENLYKLDRSKFNNIEMNSGLGNIDSSHNIATAAVDADDNEDDNDNDDDNKQALTKLENKNDGDNNLNDKKFNNNNNILDNSLSKSSSKSSSLTMINNNNEIKTNNNISVMLSNNNDNNTDVQLENHNNSNENIIVKQQTSSSSSSLKQNNKTMDNSNNNNKRYSTESTDSSSIIQRLLDKIESLEFELKQIKQERDSLYSENERLCFQLQMINEADKHQQRSNRSTILTPMLLQQNHVHHSNLSQQYARFISKDTNPTICNIGDGNGSDGNINELSPSKNICLDCPTCFNQQKFIQQQQQQYQIQPKSLLVNNSMSISSSSTTLTTTTTNATLLSQQQQHPQLLQMRNKNKNNEMDNSTSMFYSNNNNNNINNGNICNNCHDDRRRASAQMMSQYQIMTSSGSGGTNNDHRLSMGDSAINFNNQQQQYYGRNNHNNFNRSQSTHSSLSRNSLNLSSNVQLSPTAIASASAVCGFFDTGMIGVGGNCTGIPLSTSTSSIVPQAHGSNLTRTSRTTGGSTTSLASNSNSVSFNYEISQQLLDKKVSALERKYGGTLAREAAIKIQRAYRSYRLQKRFIQAIHLKQKQQQQQLITRNDYHNHNNPNSPSISDNIPNYSVMVDKYCMDGNFDQQSQQKQYLPDQQEHSIKSDNNNLNNIAPTMMGMNIVDGIGYESVMYSQRAPSSILYHHNHNHNHSNDHHNSSSPMIISGDNSGDVDVTYISDGKRLQKKTSFSSTSSTGSSSSLHAPSSNNSISITTNNNNKPSLLSSHHDRNNSTSSLSFNNNNRMPSRDIGVSFNNAKNNNNTNNNIGIINNKRDDRKNSHSQSQYSSMQQPQQQQQQQQNQVTKLRITKQYSQSQSSVNNMSSVHINNNNINNINNNNNLAIVMTPPPPPSTTTTATIITTPLSLNTSVGPTTPSLFPSNIDYGGGSNGNIGANNNKNNSMSSSATAESLAMVAGNVTDAYRKRLYRVGLNLFNKTPSERGIRFLIHHNFIEQYSTIEEQAKAVAIFLLTRKGVSRQMIGEYLSDQNPFNKEVLKAFVSEINLQGLIVDEALRTFQINFRFPGEAQKIERLVEAFADRYKECNPNDVLSRDSIFILAFAIIMLNTDLHKPTNIKHRMTPDQWLANLKGVFSEGDLAAQFLLGIYKRIKKQELQTGPDHTTQVMKVQSTMIGKDVPNLCVPHRRLVCYCRLYEIRDVNRKEKTGSHQRDVFLFNDLLLITKTTSRSRNQLAEYQYRSSTSLDGLHVSIFSKGYYAHGIRICRRVDQKILALFNARNELDQKRFVEDLRESILEMDEMEQIRITKSSSLVQLNNFMLSDVGNNVDNVTGVATVTTTVGLNRQQSNNSNASNNITQNTNTNNTPLEESINSYSTSSSNTIRTQNSSLNITS